MIFDLVVFAIGLWAAWQLVDCPGPATTLPAWRVRSAILDSDEHCASAVVRSARWTPRPFRVWLRVGTHHAGLGPDVEIVARTFVARLPELAGRRIWVEHDRARDVAARERRR